MPGMAVFVGEGFDAMFLTDALAQYGSTISLS
jgi:hypothetical protein